MRISILLSKSLSQWTFPPSRIFCGSQRTDFRDTWFPVVEGSMRFHATDTDDRLHAQRWNYTTMERELEEELWPVLVRMKPPGTPVSSGSMISLTSLASYSTASLLFLHYSSTDASATQTKSSKSETEKVKINNFRNAPEAATTIISFSLKILIKGYLEGP